MPTPSPHADSGDDPALAAAARVLGSGAGSDLTVLRQDGALTLRLRAGPDRMDVVVAGARRGGPSLLARAVGGGPGDLVVDATAGLGADASELAARGYRVLAVERHPLLALMLREAHARGVFTPEVHEGDACALLPALTRTERAHAVCIDPMFASGSLRARARKAAQVLQHLVPPGSAADDARVLAAAWPVAGRVVVKRALHAPPLAPGISFAVRGKAVRFDVYLTLGRSLPT